MATTKVRKTPITYGRPGIKLVWGGTIGAPPLEVWACSLHIACINSAGADFTLPEQYLTAFTHQCAVAVKKFWQDAAALASASFSLGFVKANGVDELGKYRSTTTYAEYLEPPVAGAASVLPWNCATVVTLRTSQKRGPGHVGRFYHPMGGFPGNLGALINPGSGQFNPDLAQGLATSAATLIHDIGTISGQSLGGGDTFPDAHFQVVTAPRSLVDANLSVNSHAIIGTEVDHVIDTMRSRTNKIPRVVSSAPVPSP